MADKIPQVSLYAAELDHPEQVAAKLTAAIRRTRTTGGRVEVVIYEWAAEQQGGGAIRSGGILSSHPGAGTPKNRF